MTFGTKYSATFLTGGQGTVISSVGRALDCSGQLLSNGRSFDSDMTDILFFSFWLWQVQFGLLI